MTGLARWHRIALLDLPVLAVTGSALGGARLFSRVLGTGALVIRAYWRGATG